MRRVGAVPKTRVGSAPLRWLPNQTHGTCSPPIADHVSSCEDDANSNLRSQHQTVVAWCQTPLVLPWIFAGTGTRRRRAHTHECRSSEFAWRVAAAARHVRAFHRGASAPCVSRQRMHRRPAGSRRSRSAASGFSRPPAFVSCRPPARTQAQAQAGQAPTVFGWPRPRPATRAPAEADVTGAVGPPCRSAGRGRGAFSPGILCGGRAVGPLAPMLSPGSPIETARASPPPEGPVRRSFFVKEKSGIGSRTGRTVLPASPGRTRVGLAPPPHTVCRTAGASSLA
jgi:hypothetical protein